MRITFWEEEINASLIASSTTTHHPAGGNLSLLERYLWPGAGSMAFLGGVAFFQAQACAARQKWALPPGKPRGGDRRGTGVASLVVFEQPRISWGNKQLL